MASVCSGQDLFSPVKPAASGVHFTNSIEDTPDHNILIYSNYYGGGGVGVGDFDQDGLPDLFFAGNLVADALYRNRGDFKFEHRQQDGILQDDGWSSGVVVADCNHDGWPDIYVTRELYDDEPERRANLLYLNNKDGSFREVGAAAGARDVGRSRHATFLDYDGDGDLDLYVLNQPPNAGNYSKLLGSDLTLPEYRSKLYRNDGNGPDGIPRFTETGSETGLNEVGFPNSVVTADFDQDGHVDLYVSHDYDAPDRLYYNNGDGTFTNEIQHATGHTSFYSMGVDAADINGDGLLDVMVLDMVAEDNYRLKANMSGMNPAAFDQVVNAGGHYQYMFNSLQVNQNGRNFSEAAHLAGVAATDWSWSNLFADLDNDGLSDLFITNGLLRDIRNTDASKEFATYVSQKLNAYIMANPDDGDVTVYDVIDLKAALDIMPSESLANYAYRNEGDLNFSDQSREWGLDHKGFSNGSAYADLNLDGHLDLIVSNINAPASIYRNRGTAGNYLRIKLLDPAHKSTFGTKVKVTSNGKDQHFETSNVRGMYSTSEQIIHVGLGTNPGAGRTANSASGVTSTVEITWPDGSTQLLQDVPANQVLTVEKAGESAGNASPKATALPIFRRMNTSTPPPYRHVENVFDDYHYQILLPHKQSRNGPCAAVADLNGDDLDDLYLGGASGQPGELYLRMADGSWSAPQSVETFRSGSLFEDVDATFFDADNDGDQDLYVVSGGNEFAKGSPFYQDRLYLNDGTGSFAIAPKGSLPDFSSSGGQVAAADYDLDGDLDLFVGGRLVPRDYPAPASSFLLRNDNGVFKDVSAELAPALTDLGLVTSAVWTDLDADGRPDLLIAGEWMPLTLLRNTASGFEKDLEFTDAKTPTTGWWYSISKGDLDGDGDEDFVFGNLGQNYKYQASDEAPFEVFYNDFDENGQRDIVLSYYNDGKLFPLRGRSCSAQQIPELKKAFPSYSDFAGATVTEVFGKKNLEASLHLTANTFQTMVGINEGGRITLKPLPASAQLGAVRTSLIQDFTGDGNPDLLLHGNLYPAEIETPRGDGNLGLLLEGDGKGKFSTVPFAKSGFLVRGDVRELRLVDGEVMVVINDGVVSFFEF